jgi:hypothetical protein
MSVVALVIAPLLVPKGDSTSSKELPKDKIEVVVKADPEKIIDLK